MSTTLETPICADGKLRPTYDEIHTLIGRSAKRIKIDFDPDLLIVISGGGLIPGRILRSFLKRPSELDPTKMRNIPTQAIGLSLYEEVAGSVEGQIGREVVRTQWLNEKTISGNAKSSSSNDASTSANSVGAPKLEEGKDAGGLLGKRILIVDEVDDTRTTAMYAYHELHKDVRTALDRLSPQERASVPETRFAFFVVHNKKNDKKGVLPILNKRQVVGGAPDSAASDADKKESVKEENKDGIVEGIWYYTADETENVWM